jgi:hypothetical protein
MSRDSTYIEKPYLAELIASLGADADGGPSRFANWQPVAATSGTDVRGTDDKVHLTSLFVPVNATIKGVGFLVGATGGTDKAIVSLYDNAGTLLRTSDPAGTTVGTAAEIQELDFETTVEVTGPGQYFVGVGYNGATATLRTVPAFTQAGLLSDLVAQTWGREADLTVPTTFTADEAPVIYTY